MKIELSTDIVKNQAKILKQFLSQNDLNITHSSALNCMSKIYGIENWNTLSAILKEIENVE